MGMGNRDIGGINDICHSFNDQNLGEDRDCTSENCKIFDPCMINMHAAHIFLAVSCIHIIDQLKKVGFAVLSALRAADESDATRLYNAACVAVDAIEKTHSGEESPLYMLLFQRPVIVM